VASESRVRGQGHGIGTMYGDYVRVDNLVVSVRWRGQLHAFPMLWVLWDQQEQLVRGWSASTVAIPCQSLCICVVL